MRKKISATKYNKIMDFTIKDSKGMPVEEVLIRLLNVAGNYDIIEKKTKKNENTNRKS